MGGLLVDEPMERTGVNVMDGAQFDTETVSGFVFDVHISHQPLSVAASTIAKQ